MKVEIEDSRTIKKFSELKCGEIFVCDNIVYIKMNDLIENNNALEFESLIMCYFPYNREVEIPKEIILKVEI